MTDRAMTDTERRLAAAVWRGFASSPFVSLTERDAESIARTLLPVVAEIEAEARVAERERVAAAIAGSVRYGFELRPDGTEDPTAAAYVEGLHDAWAIARAAEEMETVAEEEADE